MGDGLYYVGPSSWAIPELGLVRTTKPLAGAKASELRHPTTHGNPMLFDSQHVNVVKVDVTYAGNEPSGLQRFTRALDLRPIGSAALELSDQRIVSSNFTPDSQWAGIPTPTF